MNLISIIIPVYNAQKTISRAIDSVLAQTYPNIELIIVDDASTDQTATIVRQYESRFANIRMVQHTNNKQLLEARRTGVVHAKGKYILFLDADDEIDPNVCLQCEEYMRKDFDIIQFGIKLKYSTPISKDQARRDYSFFKFNAATLHSDNITHFTFRDRLASWNICGKLFKRSILSEAFKNITQTRIFLAEDACLYFIASTIADTYIGIPTILGYVYYIDIGDSSASEKLFTLKQFKQSCATLDADKLIYKYLKTSSLLNRFHEDYESLHRTFLLAIAGRILDMMKEEDVPAAFDYFSNICPAEEVTASITEIGWDRQAEIFRKIGNSSALQTSKRSIHTIGVYYCGISTGGAERVTCDLIHLWASMGYQVIIFTDWPPKDDEYSLPSSVARVVLPNCWDATNTNYYKRSKVLCTALSEYHIDIMVYAMWTSNILAWDMLSCKLSDVPFVIHTHNTIRTMLGEADPKTFDLSIVYRYADGIVTLSKTDQLFWSRTNPRTWLTVNPPTFSPSNDDRSSLDSSQILWVGRLSKEKQPEEAIRIFSELYKTNPETSLVMVGPGSEQTFSNLHDLCRKLGVEERVTFTGRKADIRPLLKNATIFLMTSSYEGYPLALAEAKSFGLPSVIYSMPYLTLAAPGTGVVQVERGNHIAAAEAIQELLYNVKLRTQLSQEAFEQAEQLASFRFDLLWNNIFHDVSLGSIQRSGYEADDLLNDTLLEAENNSLQLAIAKTRTECKEHNLVELENSIIELKQTYTYRIGLVVTWIPRKIKILVNTLAQYISQNNKEHHA